MGENKVQEAQRKSENLADLGISWSVIGHLQTNKAKNVAAFADEFQALDSLRLAGAHLDPVQGDGFRHLLPADESVGAGNRRVELCGHSLIAVATTGESDRQESSSSQLRSRSLPRQRRTGSASAASSFLDMLRKVDRYGRRA